MLPHPLCPWHSSLFRWCRVSHQGRVLPHPSIHMGGVSRTPALSSSSVAAIMAPFPPPPPVDLLNLAAEPVVTTPALAVAHPPAAAPVFLFSGAASMAEPPTCSTPAAILYQGRFIVSSSHSQPLMVGQVPPFSHGYIGPDHSRQRSHCPFYAIPQGPYTGVYSSFGEAWAASGGYSGMFGVDTHKEAVMALMEEGRPPAPPSAPGYRQFDGGDDALSAPSFAHPPSMAPQFCMQEASSPAPSPATFVGSSSESYISASDLVLDSSYVPLPAPSGSFSARPSRSSPEVPMDHVHLPIESNALSVTSFASARSTVAGSSHALAV